MVTPQKLGRGPAYSETVRPNSAMVRSRTNFGVALWQFDEVQRR